MRLGSSLSSVGVGLFFLLCLAPVSRAQDYTWIDEHGSIHVASDPSEIPPRFRKKAVDDAERATSKIVIVPTEKTPPAEKARSASKPALTPEQQKTHQEIIATEWELKQNERKSMAQEAREKDAAADRREAEDRARKEARAAEEEETGQKPSTPDGFHKDCHWDYKSQSTVCDLVEDAARMQRRSDDAYEKAKEDMGIDDKDLRDDPSLEKKLQKRANKNFQKSEPNPYAPADDDE